MKKIIFSLAFAILFIAINTIAGNKFFQEINSEKSFSPVNKSLTKPVIDNNSRTKGKESSNSRKHKSNIQKGKNFTAPSAENDRDPGNKIEGQGEIIRTYPEYRQADDGTITMIYDFSDNEGYGKITKVYEYPLGLAVYDAKKGETCPADLESLFSNMVNTALESLGRINRIGDTEIVGAEKDGFVETTVRNLPESHSANIRIISDREGRLTNAGGIYLIDGELPARFNSKGDESFNYTGNSDQAATILGYDEVVIHELGHHQYFIDMSEPDRSQWEILSKAGTNKSDYYFQPWEDEKGDDYHPASQTQGAIEDYAISYKAYVENIDRLIDQADNSENLQEKVILLSEQFLSESNGENFLRVYDTIYNYEDVKIELADGQLTFEKIKDAVEYGNTQ